MRHIYDFKKITAGPSPVRRRTKSISSRKEKILTIIFILLISGWIYTFYFSPFFSIKNVQINGSETISPLSIAELLKATERNIFRFNVKKAITAIQDVYFLESIVIQKIYPGNLVINIKEKHPAFQFSTPNYQYLLDENGLVMTMEQSSSTARRAENLPLLEDQASPTLALRQPAISAKGIEAIKFFLDNLKTENNIKVVKTILNKEDPGVITFKTSEDFEIIISYKEDIKTQLFKLSAFLNAQGEARKNLLYVNARFVERVYYKFR